jgi:hypothetical protein
MDNKILEIVRTAVLPMKEIAEDNAARVMSAHIEETLKTLEHDYKWDVEAYAPYPSSLRNGRIEFKQKLSRYQFVRGITTSVKPCRMVNEPDFVMRDDKKITRAIEKARDLAAETFEAYAYKLTGKVGTDVVAADAISEGNDLWTASALQVYHNDGTFSTWKTKTIVNCSVYGKLFLQFPTRKAKK